MSFALIFYVDFYIIEFKPYLVPLEFNTFKVINFTDIILR